MPSVPRDFNRPLQKVRWPQDTLSVPSGNGRMPAVELDNARNVGREYFTYSASAAIAAGTQTTINIPLTKDGDFWMTRLTFAVFGDFLGTLAEEFPHALVQLTDVMTQYRLFQPNIPLGALSRALVIGSVDEANLFINDIPEPYCFLRGSAIMIDIDTITVPTAASPVLYVALSGWKEYANAAI